MIDLKYYLIGAYCGNSKIAAIWRKLDDIYFNVFIKKRNPLEQINISDLTTKEEEEEIKGILAKLLDAMMNRW